MIRMIIGLFIGFGLGWVAQRYVRQFEAEDDAEARLDSSEDIPESLSLIELGSINTQAAPLTGLTLQEPTSAELEMAEAFSTALAEDEQTNQDEGLDLLLSDPNMTVERDSEGNLVITTETNQSNNGDLDDEIDLGELVAEGGFEDADMLAAEGDDLSKIKGVTPVIRARLNEAGLSKFEEIAALTAEELSELSGISLERITRNRFIEQAQELANES